MVAASTPMSYVATPVAYAAEPPIVALQAPNNLIEGTSTAETIYGLISRVAQEEKVSSTTVYNAVKSESNFDPLVIGDHGCSYGLVQINLCAHQSVLPDDARNPEYAVRYFAEALAKGQESAWSVCNCYSYIKGNYIGNLPKMADIVPNSAPTLGGVIILQYGAVKHIAYITNVDENGVYVKEANYVKCSIGKRYILFTDTHLIGFWSQSMASQK